MKAAPKVLINFGALRMDGPSIMKCKTIWAVATLLLIVAGLPPRVSAVNRQAGDAQVMEFLRVSGVADLPEQMAPLIAAQLVAMLRHSDSQFSERGVAVTDHVVSEYLAEPVRSGQLVQQLVPIYEREFTAKEIQELIAFYRTPVGRKLAASLATINAESAQVGQQWAAEMLPGLRAVLLQRLHSEGLLNY